jgi:hypothetical protein
MVWAKEQERANLAGAKSFFSTDPRYATLPKGYSLRLFGPKSEREPTERTRKAADLHKTGRATLAPHLSLLLVLVAARGKTAGQTTATKMPRSLCTRRPSLDKLSIYGYAVRRG